LLVLDVIHLSRGAHRPVYRQKPGFRTANDGILAALRFVTD
jgi:hypothetical protein